MRNLFQSLRERFVPSPKDLITNGIVLLIPAAGTLVWSLLNAMPAQYIVALFVFVVAFTLFGINQWHSFFESTKPPMTSEELERQLREWLHKSGYAVTNRPDEANALFRFSADDPNGKSVTIACPKNKPSTIVIGAGVGIAGGMKDRLDKMSRGEAITLISELRVEMARYRIAYRGINYPIQGVIELQQLFPLPENLSEHEFMQQVGFVECAVILCVELITRLEAKDADSNNLGRN